MDHSLDLHFESKILFWLIFCILDHVLHIFADSDQNPGSTNVAGSDPDPETDIRMFFFSIVVLLSFLIFYLKQGTLTNHFFLWKIFYFWRSFWKILNVSFLIPENR